MMADKMMRIAGRSNDGLAKPLKTNDSGNLQIETVNNVTTKSYAINLETSANGTVFTNLDVKDYKEVIIQVNAVGYYNVFAIKLEIGFQVGLEKRTLNKRNYQYEKQTFINTGVIPITGEFLTVDLTNLREVTQEYNVFVTLRG